MLQARKRTIFNDGMAYVYEVKNIAAPGKKPKESLEIKNQLRYKEKTVGITRMNLAMQRDNKADRLIECYQRGNVSAMDVVILKDGNQYRIINVQYPEDTRPPTMLITLERLGDMYNVSDS